jgi:hypothetical protein
MDKVVEVIHSSGWSKDIIFSLQGSEATVDRVSRALDSCSRIHFACHRSQDLILGMKSAFSLHHGHLELSEIASKNLSVGQFAFLSACHAASGLTDLLGEAMHLATGIQFAGFPIGIATRPWEAPTYVYPNIALFRGGKWPNPSPHIALFRAGCPKKLCQHL